MTKSLILQVICRRQPCKVFQRNREAAISVSLSVCLWKAAILLALNNIFSSHNNENGAGGAIKAILIVSYFPGGALSTCTYGEVSPIFLGQNIAKSDIFGSR